MIEVHFHGTNLGRMQALKIKMILALPWLLSFDGVCAGRITRSVVVKIVEQEVDDTLFTWRLDIHDGKRKERWGVAGGSVDEREYQEQLEQAQMRELRKEKALAEAREREYEAFMIDSQVALYKKLLAAEIKAVDQAYSRLMRKNFGEHLALSSQTFATSAQLERVGVVLARARELVSLTTHEGFAALKECYHELSTFQDKLLAVYRASVARAIEKSDDTSFLKDLLAQVGDGM